MARNLLREFETLWKEVQQPCELLLEIVNAFQLEKNWLVLNYPGRLFSLCFLGCDEDYQFAHEVCRNSHVAINWNPTSGEWDARIYNSNYAESYRYVVMLGLVFGPSCSSNAFIFNETLFTLNQTHFWCLEQEDVSVKPWNVAAGLW